MNCPKCKSELKQDAKFCNNCGCKIESPPTYPEKKSGGRKILTCLIVVFLFLALAIGVMVFCLFGKKQEESSASGEPQNRESRETTVEEIIEETLEETIETTEAVTAMETEMPTTAEMPTAEATPTMAEEAVTIPATTIATEVAQTNLETMSHSQWIEHIRQVYYQIKEEEGTLEEDTNGFTYKDGEIVKYVRKQSSDSEVDILMKEYGYSNSTLEYYYDPEITGEGRLLFLFAAIDGKEYRYYYRNDQLIRRIGPEGTINDNPEENDFLRRLRMLGT